MRTSSWCPLLAPSLTRWGIQRESTSVLKKLPHLCIQQIVIAVMLKYALKLCVKCHLLLTGQAGQTVLMLQLYVFMHFVLLENNQLCCTARWAICLQSIFCYQNRFQYRTQLPTTTDKFVLYFHIPLHSLFFDKNFEIAKVDGAYSSCSVQSRAKVCIFQQVASLCG